MAYRAKCGRQKEETAKRIMRQAQREATEKTNGKAASARDAGRIKGEANSRGASAPGQINGRKNEAW